MSYYLQMDGVDDYIKTPNITFNKIIIDFKPTFVNGINQTYLDARAGHSNAYFSRFSNGYDTRGTGIVSAISDGIEVGRLDGVSTSGNQIQEVRNELTVTMASVAIDDVNLFSNQNNASPLKANVYDIKFHNNDTLIAHYDMSTGTVQDQSGNGNHATLIGGTWVKDTPINPDPIAIQSDFSTKQIISKQTTEQINTKQAIFKQTTDNFAVKQTISKQTIDNFNVKQIIRKQITFDFATNQIITATSSYFYDFSTKQIIHKQATENIQTKQSIFKSALVEVPAKQTIYKATINDSLTKQILFKTVVEDNKVNLIIFRRVTSDVPTIQRVIQEGGKEYNQEINLTFFINRSVDLDFKIVRKVPLTFKI